MIISNYDLKQRFLFNNYNHLFQTFVSYINNFQTNLFHSEMES